MKANELRIGNVIEYQGSYSNYKGVIELNYHLFSYLLEVDDEWDLVKAVPLNTQRFLELGFNRQVDIDTPDIWKTQCYNANLTFCISKIDLLFRYGFNGFSNHCFIHFQNVHQLQNLFYEITGEELPSVCI